MVFHLLKISAVLCLLMVSPYLYAQETAPASSDSVFRENTNAINEKRKGVVDSVKRVGKVRPRIQTPSVDSVGVSFENGKWQGPGKPDEDGFDQKIPGSLSTESIKDIVPSGPGGADVRGVAESAVPEDLKSRTDRIISKKDSVENLMEAGRRIMDSDLDGSLPSARVYSRKALKRLYDSLGISKIDSIMALLPRQEETSKEDFIDELNSAFLDKQRLPDTGQLSQISDHRNKLDQLQKPDLSEMKLGRHELMELAPVRSFRLPSDSLGVVDSLQRLQRMKDRIAMEENKIGDIKKVVLSQRPKFSQRPYFEGLLGFYKDMKFQDIQFSPALALPIHKDLSAGAGVVLQLQQHEEKWKFGIGYRAFAKYEIMKQRAYLLSEYMQNPVVTNMEQKGGPAITVLAGGGYLVPLSGRLAMNVCVLYRVHNENSLQTSRSPWVLRIGLSSIKTKNGKD